MDDKSKLDKREYYRKWRAEHREQVQAAQMRYWAKKAKEARFDSRSDDIEQNQQKGG